MTLISKYQQYSISLIISLLPFLVSVFSFMIFIPLNNNTQSCIAIYDYISYIERSLVTITDDTQTLSGVLIKGNFHDDLVITSTRRMNRLNMQNALYSIQIQNIDSVQATAGDFIPNKNIGFIQITTPSYISGLSFSSVQPSIGEIGYTATLVNNKLISTSGRYLNSITLDNGNLVHIYSGEVDISYEGSPVIDQCGKLLGIIIEGNEKYFAISSMPPELLNNTFN